MRYSSECCKFWFDAAGGSDGRTQNATRKTANMQTLVAAAALMEAKANLSAAIRTGAGAKELEQRRAVVAALTEVMRLMTEGRAWQDALMGALQKAAALEPEVAAAALPANIRRMIGA